MRKLTRSRIPVSLLFFAETALVFLLQAIPVTGIFLMFARAMVWSAILVNAEMIGVAICGDFPGPTMFGRPLAERVSATPLSAY